VSYSTIKLDTNGAIATLTLSRAEVRNAINAEMIRDLRECVDALAADPPRVLVLAGEGALFCAGADAKWMAETGRLSADENYADALALADLLAALNTLPCPVLARVQGGAYGGGIGFMSCCDAVVCTDSAAFSFGEARLGLTPATIAPYVIAKIGASAVRELFMSAARFDAQRALAVGLVHEVVAETELDSSIQKRVEQYLACGPEALKTTKQLIATLQPALSEQREATAQLIAELRASDEGREGLAAFLCKRKPKWVEDA
jgi:methylglutaconyl-CoA hydratase